jgi:hypothetical protein
LVVHGGSRAARRRMESDELSGSRDRAGCLRRLPWLPHG